MDSPSCVLLDAVVDFHGAPLPDAAPSIPLQPSTTALPEFPDNDIPAILAMAVRQKYYFCEATRKSKHSRCGTAFKMLCYEIVLMFRHVSR